VRPAIFGNRGQIKTKVHINIFCSNVYIYNNCLICFLLISRLQLYSTVMFNPFTFLLKVLLLVLLPFIGLIRLSVYFHISQNLLPWVCIALATLMTVILLFIYLTFLHAWVTDYASNTRYTIKRRIGIAAFVVLLYVIHGIFYIGGTNIKSEDIRSEIREVHPILRLSVSTLIHLDKELLITDSARLPEDYQKMGLPSKNQSLHYRQSTGYAHAIDIRTNNRPEWKNLLVRTYFIVMGFRTLRHHGTADHLHVSLLSHAYPNAK